MYALLRKEFRESVRWLPLGWLLIGGMLWATLPGLDQLDKSTQFSIALVFSYAIGCSFVALGLSIAQFIPDQRSAARAFLMHRGLTPKQLFRGKLAVGIAIYLLTVGVPLLISAIYLEWIGPLRLPTSARQTIPAWIASIFAFSFYFGGSMVACGNARWIGTRVLPLAVSFLVTCSVVLIIIPAPLGTSVTFLCLGAIGLVILFFASQETFANGTSRDTPGAGPRNHWSRNVVLTVSSIAAATIAIAFPTTFTAQFDLSRFVVADVDASGELWFELHERGYTIERAKISSDPEAMVVEKVTDSQQLGGSLNVLYKLQWENTNWFSADKLGIYGPNFVFDTSGYILAYTATSNDRQTPPTWMLNYVIGQDRISRPLESRGKPFEKRPRFISRDWLITQDGLYWIDEKSGLLRQVVSKHVDGYALDFDRQKQRNFIRLFLTSGSNLMEYQLPDSLEPNQALEPESEVDLGSKWDSHVSSFNYESQDFFTLISRTGYYGFHVIQKRPGKELERFTCKPPAAMNLSYPRQSQFVNGLICMALPVVYILIAGAILLISVYGFGVVWPEIAADGGEPGWMVAGAVVFLIQAILSSVLAYAVARHRGLSPKARIGWAIGGAFGGFGIALAIIAIYQRCIRETCWQCKRSRRVELLLCDHCGWEWETPAKDGTEVLDETRVETVAC